MDEWYSFRNRKCNPCKKRNCCPLTYNGCLITYKGRTIYSANLH
jgi:hypothetical protein